MKIGSTCQITRSSIPTRFPTHLRSLTNPPRVRLVSCRRILPRRPPRLLMPDMSIARLFPSRRTAQSAQRHWRSRCGMDRSRRSPPEAAQLPKQRPPPHPATPTTTSSFVDRRDAADRVRVVCRRHDCRRWIERRRQVQRRVACNIARPGGAGSFLVTWRKRSLPLSLVLLPRSTGRQQVLLRARSNRRLLPFFLSSFLACFLASLLACFLAC